MLFIVSFFSKFINMLMREGKKTQAERAFVKVNVTGVHDKNNVTLYLPFQALELIKRTQIAK